MNRRRFIRISIITGIGVIAAGLLRYYDFETVVIKILRKDLQGFNMEEESFKKYVEDARGHRHWQKIFIDRKMKALTIFYFFLPDLKLPHQSKYLQMKNVLIGDFLLATDFFKNKMDEKRKIKYIGLFDPYQRPCSNPFSNVFYPL
jgi:hypothetical protein